jgi:hypothetical protein
MHIKLEICNLKFGNLLNTKINSNRKNIKILTVIFNNGFSLKVEKELSQLQILDNRI